MSFKFIATITSIIALILGVGYIFFGAAIVGRWGIEPVENVLLLGRRMGSLYLGLSVMFFLVRSSEVSTARTALIAGTAFALSLLVVFGLYELAAGRVGKGILLSIFVEALLAVSYIQVLLGDRKSGRKGTDNEHKILQKDKEVIN